MAPKTRRTGCLGGVTVGGWMTHAGAAGAAGAAGGAAEPDASAACAALFSFICW